MLLTDCIVGAPQHPDVHHSHEARRHGNGQLHVHTSVKTTDNAPLRTNKELRYFMTDDRHP